MYINKVIYTIASVNTNASSLRSADLEFMMNPNGLVEDKCIVIFSNMLELPIKGILSTNQVCATGHFCYYKPKQIGRKQILVTVDARKGLCFLVMD